MYFEKVRKIYKSGNKLQTRLKFLSDTRLKNRLKNTVRRLSLKLKTQHLTVLVTCAHRQF